VKRIFAGPLPAGVAAACYVGLGRSIHCIVWFGHDWPIGKDESFMLATNGECYVQRACPIGCQHKTFIPAKAKALACEWASLLGTQSTDHPNNSTAICNQTRLPRLLLRPVHVARQYTSDFKLCVHVVHKQMQFSRLHSESGEQPSGQHGIILGFSSN